MVTVALKKVLSSMVLMGMASSAFAQYDRPNEIMIILNQPVEMTIAGYYAALELDYEDEEVELKTTTLKEGKACFSDGLYSGKLSNKVSVDINGPKDTYCCLHGSFYSKEDTFKIPKGTKFVSSTENRRQKEARQMQTQGVTPIWPLSDEWMAFEADLSMVGGSQKLKNSIPDIKISCYSGYATRQSLELKNIKYQFSGYATIKALK